MRRLSMTLAAACVCMAGVAQAQTPATPATPSHSVEFTVGPTFGASTDLAFGGAFGMMFTDHAGVFIEGGRMQNALSSDFNDAANVIAKFISGTATPKQTVNYGDVGLRYVIPTTGRIEPFVSVGVGVAKVRRDTTFAVNGTDVTSQLLPKYGVLLGGDLSGSENKMLVVGGFGAHIKLTGNLFGTASVRFGRIFLSEAPLSTTRLEIGAGLRF